MKLNKMLTLISIPLALTAVTINANAGQPVGQGAPVAQQQPLPLNNADTKIVDKARNDVVPGEFPQSELDSAIEYAFNAAQDVAAMQTIINWISTRDITDQTTREYIHIAWEKIATLLGDLTAQNQKQLQKALDATILAKANFATYINQLERQFNTTDKAHAADADPILSAFNTMIQRSTQNMALAGTNINRGGQQSPYTRWRLVKQSNPQPAKQNTYEDLVRSAPELFSGHERLIVSLALNSDVVNQLSVVSDAYGTKTAPEIEELVATLIDLQVNTGLLDSLEKALKQNP